MEGNGLSVTELLLRSHFSSNLLPEALLQPLSERQGAAHRQSLVLEDGRSNSGKRTEFQFLLFYNYSIRLVF